MTENQSPQHPHPMQAACRYISDVLAGNAPAGEKRIAREIMHLLPLFPAPEGGELPPLPEPAHSREAPDYTAEQMRAYARAALAAQPQAAREYQQANPLGGPAKVFRAMADAIEAGDSYEDTLRRYGYAEAAPSPAEGDALRAEAMLHAAKCRTMAARLFNDAESSRTDAGDRLLYAAQLLGAMGLALSKAVPDVQPKGMPDRDWLEGMVSAWRTNAAEQEGEGWHTSADAFRTCAADLERALRLNPRDADPSPAPAPIDMVLHCPSCGLQHIDAPDERTEGWKNEPHRSHLCHGCGHIWRPADVPTNGVHAVQTKGKADSPIRSPAVQPWKLTSEALPEAGTECVVLVRGVDGKLFPALDKWEMQSESPVGWTSHTIETGLMWSSHEFEDVVAWMRVPDCAAIFDMPA